MRRRRFVRHMFGGAALAQFPAVDALATQVPSGGQARRPDTDDGRSTPDPASDPLRVLVLGGTNYVGPHLVRACLERGHEVTVFNRGLTNPDLLPGVERLVGSRFEDRRAGLDALRGGREWDVVLDTWQFEPGCVDRTAELLAGRAGRYVYVSSIAVYGSFRNPGLDEGSPTVEAGEAVGSLEPEMPYPVRKRAAELAVERRFGDRAVVLRCSSVYGHDASASVRNQQCYWPLRFLSNEPVIVPDDPGAVLQWTDARDVGRFAVRLAEQGEAGTFNLVSPAEPLPLSDYFAAWLDVSPGEPDVVTVPGTVLRERGVRPWTDLPIWIPADDPEPGFFRVSAARAHATGFPSRPLRETLSDVVRTYVVPPAPETATEGMDRRRELALAWELSGQRSWTPGG